MKLIDIAVAAQKLSVSPTTIRRMIKDPQSPLRAYKVNKAVRITQESLDECLKPIPKLMVQ